MNMIILARFFMHWFCPLFIAIVYFKFLMLIIVLLHQFISLFIANTNFKQYPYYYYYCPFFIPLAIYWLPFYMLPFFNFFLSHFTPGVFYLFLFIDIFIVFILQTSVILSLLLSTIVIYYPFIAFVLAIIVINFPFSLTNQMIKLVNSIHFSGQDLYYFVLVKHQNKYEVFHKSFG